MADRNKIEAAAKAKLHGVEMPKQIDFTSKTLYHDYVRFKTLTKKILDCYEGLEEKILVNKVLMWMGPDACVKHANHPFPAEDNQRLEPLWEFFNGICAKKDGTEGSWNAARMKLKFMKQLPEETVDKFYDRIRDILQQCEYPEAISKVMEAEALKYGFTDIKIPEKVYALPKDATAEAILGASRAEEAAQRHLREVYKVKKEHNLDDSKTTEELRRRPGKGQQRSGFQCQRCGTSHPPRKCPAFGQVCMKCQKKGHFAKFCKTRNSREAAKPATQKPVKKTRIKKKFHEATAEDSSSEEEDSCNSEFDVNTDTVEAVHKAQARTVFCKKLPKHIKEVYFDDDLGPDTQYAVVRIEHKDGQCTRLKGKVDSGSQVCILNIATFKKIYGLDAQKKLQPSSVRLTGYGGKRFTNHGKFRVDKIHHNNILGRRVEFYISDCGSNIFSLRFCKAMRILKLLCDDPRSCNDCHGDFDISEVGRKQKGQQQQEDKKKKSADDRSKKPYSLRVDNPIEITSTKQVIRDAPDVFSGVGKLKGYKYKIELDEKVPPVVAPPRRVPEKVKTQLKEELDRMEAEGIIMKQHKANEWVSSLVCAPKPNGKLRICLDPKPLNRAIRRPHHYTQTLNEILPKLSKCKYFGTLDQLSGYWNIQMHEDSIDLLTFNTPFGRYSFKRMPFGLKSSQDVFQRAVDQTFGDIPDVYVIADDILIAAETKKKFDLATNRVLQRCRDSGFKLNPDKAKILLEEVHYFGYLLTKEGLKPDPRKVKAIKKIAPPTNKRELQSLLGCFNYLGRFIPNLSAKTYDLRQLIKKGMEFQWTASHSRILEELKKCVVEAPTLQYFDPEKEITIECDASKKGLGATLLQEGKPIDFASRSLTDVETRYSNIEREMLGVVWAVLHYKQYVYGQRFIVKNDHSPLEPIFKKDLHSITVRLQRMVMQLQGYDMSIVYQKGKEMYVPDCLSRCIPEASSKPRPVFSALLNAGIFEVNTTNETDVQKIRKETKTDPALSELMKLIQNGWPEHKNQLPDQTMAYWNYRYDLALLDGLVIRGNRIVIPQSLRSPYLKRLHRVHQGITKTLERSREKFFWPGMTEQIKQMILSCPDCLENQSRQKPATVIPITTTMALQVIGMDIFQHSQQHYQCIVDYHTGYPWVKQLKKLDTEHVIKHLQEVCDLFGYPSTIISDHGSQYTSEKFQQLCMQYNIVHSPATPHSQWQNGRCESTIGKLKMLMEKSKKEVHLQLSEILTTIRDTPLDHQTPSPYELMFHRKVKTDLPSIPLNLWDTPSSARAGYRSVRHAEQQNKSRTSSSQLEEDQPVMFIKDPSDKKIKWSPGKIKTVDGERSYTIKDTSSGTEFKRNRTHLKPVPEAVPEQPELTATPTITPAPTTVPAEVPDDPQPLTEPPEIQHAQPQIQPTPATPRVKTPKKTKTAKAPTAPPVTTSRPKRTIKAPEKYGDWVPK